MSTLMKIATCDDEEAICYQIEEILRKHADTLSLTIEVEHFYSGESLVETLNKNTGFDLIFLDIEMYDLTGVDVGKKIRKIQKDHSTQLVYVTGAEGYERALFDVQPLCFIPKPIDSEKITDAVDLALLRIGMMPEKFSYIKERTVQSVSIDEIIYFEANGRKVDIVTEKGVDSFYGSLGQIVDKLSGHKFFKISRYWLINYNHVSTLKAEEVVLDNGETLPISRHYRDVVRDFQRKELK